MAWQTVAEGASFEELEQLVEDMELPKGTRVKAVMDLKLPIGWAFDAPGAELLFKYRIPEGLKLLDVYGEGSQAIVEMEADPAWLVAMLVFIKANWLSILIATVVLGLVIMFIRIMIQITKPGLLGIPWWIWILGGGAIIALLVLPKLLQTTERVLIGRGRKEEYEEG